MPHLGFSALTSCLLQLATDLRLWWKLYLPTMKSSTLNSWICFGGASLGCQACIACWAIGQWSYWSLGRCPNRFSIWWDQHLKTFVGVLAWLIPMTLLWEMEWRNALAAETFYTRSTLHTFTKTCTYSSWPSCESRRILSWSYVHQSKVMHTDPMVGFTVNQTQCVLLWSITFHQPLIWTMSFWEESSASTPFQVWRKVFLRSWPYKFTNPSHCTSFWTCLGKTSD